MFLFDNRPVTLNATRQFLPHYRSIRTKQEKNLYPTNFITTSRYNIISFLPFSLLGQFSRYANIYFLIIAILQSISIISPLDPSSAIAPLVFVLGLSMLREGYEDFQRHRSDNEVNATPCTQLLNSHKVETTWANVQVGDLILVEDNQPFPADLLILGSSYENGVCYIETSSLDGEKNLKPKSAIKETQDLYKSYKDYRDTQIYISGMPPTQALYEFEGQITMDGGKIIVGPKQLLLRGAYLRNTQWVIGVVVYTGMDTKIMRNSEPGRIKQSEIEHVMNNLILCILCMQFVLCLISACMSTWWLNKNRATHTYIIYDYNTSALSTIAYFSYFLLYNTMIPISLVVSLEFVKVFQSYFITKDEEMYVAHRNRYADVKTTTINEELGQVEYIFSDKTGTLTCNQMEFKYCIVGDTLYGQDEDNNVKEPLKQDIISYAAVHPQKKEQFKHSVFNFQDENLQKVIEGVDEKIIKFDKNIILESQDKKVWITITNQKQLVDYYFFLLASAHECLYQTDEDESPIYQGPSPDEITLVDAAAHLGYIFTGASASEQTFKIQGHQKRVEMLKSFEFDSDRKRMSVIIRDGGIIKLFIKGADSIIKSRLAKEQPFLSFIEGKLDEFSRVGLRTLLMATKVLSEEEYTAFESKYNEVGQVENRQELLNEIVNQMEQDLYLVGATAVEDKLQYQVPETIADLLRANIKIWMLTGDKLETAENIAKSCRLIQGDMTVLHFSEKTLESLKEKFNDNLEVFENCLKINRKKSLVIEGESLALITTDQTLKQMFVYISSNCESVVCCRVTPKQKATVVKLIKDNLKKITLAIGDGANDVNMIQEAHIGIGLYGNEGMRAVQSSDFALGEFRCLWRLLLVHGHWSYIRISEMILYFFYKNMIFTVPQFFFAFFSAFSSQSFFDDWYITFYNMIFTALPLIIRATFDQDINYKFHVEDIQNEDGRNLQKKQEKYLKHKFPEFYFVGQQKTIFSIPNYLFWAFQGTLHGLLVFFFCYWCLGSDILSKEGYTVGLPSFSITVMSSIIMIVNIKISLYTKFWTWLNWFSILILSVGIYFAYIIAFETTFTTLAYYTPSTLLKFANYWLLLTINVSIVFLFDILQGAIIREIIKTPVDQMRAFVNTFNYHLKEHLDKRYKKNEVYDENHISKAYQIKKILKENGGSFWEQVRKEEERTPIESKERPVDDTDRKEIINLQSQ